MIELKTNNTTLHNTCRITTWMVYVSQVHIERLNSSRNTKRSYSLGPCKISYAMTCLNKIKM